MVTWSPGGLPVTARAAEEHRDRSVASGLDPRTVQDFPGHANVRTTLEIYARGMRELRNRASAVMCDERAMAGEEADEGTEGQTRRKAP
jgi:integrase